MSTASTIDIEEVRAEWLDAIRRLQGEIATWAQEQGWEVETEEKEIREGRLGTYLAPVLNIQAPEGRLVVEPKARFVYGTDGGLEFYAWPSFHRVRLLRRDGRWTVRTDSGIDWPHGWSKATFRELAHALAVAQ